MVLRFADYFLHLSRLFGFGAACRFSLAYVKNRLFPPTAEKLGCIPLGPYVLYFASVGQCAWLLIEIFFREAYFIQRTDRSINVIDCGAHIGVPLLYIKTRAPNAHVLCFEPNPTSRHILEQNITANGWGGEVEVVEAALGRHKGTAEFFVEQKDITSTSAGLTRQRDNGDRIINTHQVEVTILSDYIHKPVDLLKIDIEGNEFAVLEDLVEHGSLRHVRALQLEYHYDPGFFTRPLSELLEILEQAGFESFFQTFSLPHEVVGRDVRHAYMVYAWRKKR